MRIAIGKGVFDAAAGTTTYTFTNKIPDTGKGTWVISGDLMGAVEGSGKIKSEPRAVHNFDAIAIEYPAEILNVQGAKES